MTTKNCVNGVIITLKDTALDSSPCGGYRKHHSTINQMVYLENAIKNRFIEGKHMFLEFFELEEAFDKT